jgi:MFS family permease
MGLIMLALAAVLIFFGLTERMFRSLRIANWVGFIIILGFAIGAIAPDIFITGYLSVNVGGFILPTIFMAGLAILCMRQKNFLRPMAAETAVMALTIVMLFFFPQGAMWQRVLCSLLIGILGGALAYAVGGHRVSILFAVFGGVAMGELTMRVSDFMFVSGSPILLGSGVAFDAMITAAVVGIAIAEIAARVRLKNADRATAQRALNFEAGRDADLLKRESARPKTDDFSDYFDDSL